MEEVGYNNYYAVLNAKDYGIPQNRERVFIISIRKDIDKGFTFPEPVPLELRLKDILEDQVDDKYYLSDTATRNLFVYSEPKEGEIKVVASTNPDKKIQDRTRILGVDGISQSLRATDYKDPVKIGIDKSSNTPKVLEVDNCITAREDRGISRRKSEGTAVIEVREATKKGYAEASVGDSVNLEQPNSKTRRGRVGKGVAQTLTTSCNQAVVVPSEVDDIEAFLNE